MLEHVPHRSALCKIQGTQLYRYWRSYQRTPTDILGIGLMMALVSCKFVTPLKFDELEFVHTTFHGNVIETLGCTVDGAGTAR